MTKRWAWLCIASAVVLALVLWLKLGEPQRERWAARRAIDRLGEIHPEVEVELLNEHLVTFKMRHNRSAGRDAIVFIHGYGGHPLDTWGDTIEGLARTPYENPEFAWLAQFDVVSVSYPTGIGEGTSIDDAASRFKDLVGRHVFRSSYENVYVVAHSMGGLVVQRALLDWLAGEEALAQANLAKIKAFAYFDSPHDGLELRDSGSPLGWFVKLENETAEMAAGSDFRARLHRDWLNAFETQEALARRLFVERAWIFESDETAQAFDVVEGLKYQHFRHPTSGRMASAQTVAGETHTSICKAKIEEILTGEGFFHGLVAPLLGRDLTLTSLGRTPWGLSLSVDEDWMYVTAQEEAGRGSVRRIATGNQQIDSAWEAAVGHKVHDFLEIASATGRIGVATDLGPTDDRADNGLSLIDLADGRPLGRVLLGGRPDDLDASGSLLAVSDSEDGHIWLYDAARGRLVDSDPDPVTAADGRPMSIRGVRWIRGGRQLLAVGDRGVGSELAELLLFDADPARGLALAARTRTRATPVEVHYLEDLDLACIASWSKPGSILCHPLMERELAPREQAWSYDFEGSAQPAALAVAGSNRLFVACQNGTAKRIDWENGVPTVSSYEHGGLESWSIATNGGGDRVYITNGGSGSVKILDAQSRLWVRQP